MKILSFIIPAYNSAAYLDKCVGSMLVPECQDSLEILIVNDGSTDQTAEIAQAYCSQYPNTVRLLSQPNKGHGGALNTGCKAAQGKYLKVIDADDWVQTENLPLFLAKLAECSSDVVLTHHHTIDIQTGEVKSWKSYPVEFDRAYSFDEIMADWKGFDRSLTFHGVTYRTDFYQRLGGDLLEHVFYEDHQYATFPCCYAKSVTPLDLFIYEYRIGDVHQSVSDANQCKRIGHTAAVIQKMIDEYSKLPENMGKSYAAMKIQGLLMSYMTTALLVFPDRKAGRKLAREQMAVCMQRAPKVAQLAQKKYRVFMIFNHIHIGNRTWNRILQSKLYNTLRRNHSFD